MGGPVGAAALAILWKIVLILLIGRSRDTHSVQRENAELGGQATGRRVGRGGAAACPPPHKHTQFPINMLTRCAHDCFCFIIHLFGAPRCLVDILTLNEEHPPPPRHTPPTLQTHTHPATHTHSSVLVSVTPALSVLDTPPASPCRLLLWGLELFTAARSKKRQESLTKFCCCNKENVNS